MSNAIPLEIAISEVAPVHHGVAPAVLRTSLVSFHADGPTIIPRQNAEEEDVDGAPCPKVIDQWYTNLELQSVCAQVLKKSKRKSSSKKKTKDGDEDESVETKQSDVSAASQQDDIITGFSLAGLPKDVVDKENKLTPLVPPKKSKKSGASKTIKIHERRHNVVKSILALQAEHRSEMSGMFDETGLYRLSVTLTKSDQKDALQEGQQNAVDAYGIYAEQFARLAARVSAAEFAQTTRKRLLLEAQKKNKGAASSSAPIPQQTLRRVGNGAVSA